MVAKNVVKYALSIVAALTVGAFADSTSASMSPMEKITELAIHMNGANHAIVRMTNVIPQAQRPACHQTWWDRQYIFDVSTARGRAMLSVLTSAYLAGKPAQVNGANTCTTVGPDIIETANGVRLY
jgi:hypothetical protein